MSTLFPKTITLSRAVGSYVNGIWVEGSPDESTFQGSVQPATGKDLISLDVGREDLGKVKVYSSSQLQVSKESGDNAGDVVIWQSSRWEVIAEMANQNGLINHFKYLAEMRGEAA